MGVTYKLKKEIIDFLVNEKKANPQLGCRNLANIVEQKFQVKISKSSVNSVIKEAQLSSSVGRKPVFVEKKQSKFKIPDKKKSQLFPPLEPREILIVPKDSLNHVSSNPLPKTDDSLPKFPQRQVSTRDEISSLEISKKDKRVLHDAMGCFFLKAAEWEVSCNSVLGNMLAKHMVATSRTDISLVSDLFLFLPMFGVDHLEEFKKYIGSGLWAMHGLKEAIEYSTVVQFLENIKDLKSLALRISNEIPQIFSEGKYVKIFLEDKSEIIFDPNYRSVWKENVQSFDSIPTQKAIFDIIRKIIINVQSVVFYNLSENNNLRDSFYNLIASFENLPGKRIVKAALLDENDREIAEFTAIPFKKRFFIAGGDLGQKEIQGAYNEKLCFEPFLNNCREMAIEFSEQEIVLRRTAFLPQEILLRVLFFREVDSKDPMPSVVLTNIPKAQKFSQEIIIEFLKRWPVFLDKENTFLEILDKNFYENTKISYRFYENSLKEKGKSFLTQEIPSIWDNIHVLLCALNQYCQRHFFPPEYAQQDIETMKSRFYQLPGYLVKDGHCLTIHLKLPEEYIYRQDLEFALKRFNNREIWDPDGLRVFIQTVREK